MDKTGAAVRAAAARVIDATLEQGRSLSGVLAPELQALADRRDRALLEAICLETLRRLRHYRGLRGRLLSRPLPPSARPIASLLLIGLAQLDGLRLPDYAAISATVEAARLLRRPRLVGVVNAILRRFVREREALTAQADAQQHYDHPDWLSQQLRIDWGNEAEAILEANNSLPPLWLRVNASKIQRADYIIRLAAAGIAASAPDTPATAARLDTPLPPTALPGWEKGWISVQDGAAQFAALLLDPHPGDRVLDACAAPGGKTAQILETVPQVAELVALDNDGERLRRMAGNLQWLGLSAILCIADAAEPEKWWDGRPFDRILLDAPCSATGVIRRHPDIKWHRRARDVEALVGTQHRLLEALWALLRPGGRLVYATCSILKVENQRQIDAFLSRHSDALALAVALPVGRASGSGWQILPGEGGMDGFFYAMLEKALPKMP